MQSSHEKVETRYAEITSIAVQVLWQIQCGYQVAVIILIYEAGGTDS